MHKNNQTKSIVIYTEADIEKLKNEIKQLNLKLKELTDKKDELLSDIYDYNRLYYLELGDIIEKILKIKNSKANSKIEKNYSKKLDSKFNKKKLKKLKNKLKNIKKELEIAQKDSVEYKKILLKYNKINMKIQKIEKLYNINYKASSNKSYTCNNDFQPLGKKHINKEKNDELRVLYKKACKLCHPDIVSKDIKNIAEKIFKNLNQAYNLGNIEDVKHILLSLENGIYYDVTHTITNKKFLKYTITKLKINIEKINIEIKELRENEIIQIINEYPNLYDYFKKIRKNLEEEYINLKKKYKKN